MKTHSGIVVHLLVVYYARMMLSDVDHRAQRKSILEERGTYPRLTTQERRERELRSASSLEEVLRLTNSPDWRLWKCRLKVKSLQPSPQRESYRPSPAGSHRSTRFAAASYSREPGQEITQEILQAIDEEWQKTQCVPRDMCVDVAKELGTNLGVFFKPPCVSVFRCNGCCNNEGVTCRNTSTAYVNKTLLMLIPFHNKPEPVLIKVANHTECNCLEPALIRRHARPHRRNGCSLVQRTAGLKDTRNLCATGLIWDCMADQCIPYPSRHQEFSPSPRMPDCEIDVDRCDCVPRNITRPLHRCYLNSGICASEHKDFDQVFCRCK